MEGQATLEERAKCRRATEIVAVMACAILALCNCLVCPHVFWPIAAAVVGNAFGWISLLFFLLSI